MKKLMLLSAALLAMQAAPAFAEDGAKPAHEKGKGMERMFEKLDADKDGTISEAQSVDAAKKRFAETDANKDGKLTKEEMKAHHDAKKAEWKAKREANKTGDAPKPE